ncbi:MAG: TIGR03089 family protein [Actinomycetota bacterium]|nr:TIGR03089 family protein [Nocardioidaceae bacterium]MDQ3480660.1 TIGR03089 family protein [Actinomycetota bacterium]
MPAISLPVTTALANALATEPGRPLVTYYDTTSGERIELSVKTFDNWVSKIANLLGDDLGLEAGQGIRVELPPHWQSTVTVVAAWAAGLRLVAQDASSPEDVSVVGPAALHTADTRPAGVVIACSLRPLAGAFVDPLPAGWLDFAREVPGQPDLLLLHQPTSGRDVALEQANGTVTHAELARMGLSAAERLGLRAGGRLITDANPADPTGLVNTLVAPLVTGSSVVLVVGADASTRTRITEQEQADCVLWLDG